MRLKNKVTIIKLFTIACAYLMGFFPLHSFANQLGYSPLIYGSGKLLRDNINLPAIKTVEISGIAHVYIQQSTSASNQLTIEAEDNIMPSLQHVVKGSTLYIGLKNSSIHPTHPINYKLKIKNVTTIKAAGDSKILCQDGLKIDSLSVAVLNNAFANIWFNGAKFSARVGNAGSLIVGGFAKQQDIVVNERGSFDGKQLRGYKGTLAITYSGQGTINVANELSVTMLAGGCAKYVGMPTVIRKISDQAALSRLK